jgi:glycosyltransferase involved in cell wall biosynthesis
MNSSQFTTKAAILGDYPPRKCGIATFTRDLRDALNVNRPDWDCPVVTVTDPSSNYQYPPEVRFEIPEPDAAGYERAADFLNLSRADVLCVQHEFGIFGGPAGGYITNLLRRARMPVVTTFHTILANPTAEQRRAFSEIIECSRKIVVMTNHGAEMLRDIHGVPADKISIIPHGIPDIPFADPNFYKDHFGVAGRPVLLTFGLLSPGKGIEYALRALPEIVREQPDVIYIILGASHPNQVRHNGESHRESLEQLAKELGVERNVMFVNRYVENEELCEFIGAADIYLTPYLNESQITSGTLAYCFGAGKAVVSTPYWHAAELLSEDRGMLVPFRDDKAIATAVLELFSNEARRHAMRKQAYLMGRGMVWSEVAADYAKVFEEARQGFQARGRRLPPRASVFGNTQPLPAFRFGHFKRMCDSTGIFQHAIFSVPWFEHGYCTDDNARALLLTVLLEELCESDDARDHIQSASAAFLQCAFCGSTGRFKNFMGFDRRWTEEQGSEDSHGRAIWALGAVVGRTRLAGLRSWAASLLEQALPAVEGFTSPRAWAFSILGLHEYFRSLHGDLHADRRRDEIAGRLFDLFRQNASPDWPWCEDIAAYDNPRIAQALILAGRFTGNQEMKKTGLSALSWLMENQTGVDGCFRPIGSNGFWKRGTAPAIHDQQPLEAAAAVSACIEAYNATEDPVWEKSAKSAFAWFLGDNDLRLPLYDPSTGGCFDGLHDNRVNQNQGAESTLSFLLALAEMQAFQKKSPTPDANVLS